MSTYIGKRIVPVHCGRWEKKKSYEMLSIVLEEKSGDSYIARHAVPAGTDIGDESCWMLHSLYSQQIKDMSEQVTEAEKRIARDNDETAEHIDKTVSAVKKEVLEQVSDAKAAMTAQKQEFDETAASLNTRMDAVLAAGTGVGETEILDARVDAEGAVHETLGAAVRAVGQETVDARVGFDGSVSPSLCDAMQSFKEPFVFQRRAKLTNLNVPLTGKGDYTKAGCENIRDASGVVRAAKFTAEILKEYDRSSMMSKSFIDLEEFRRLFLGRRMIVQLVSPIDGVVNFSVGYGSSDGGGEIDDHDGTPLNGAGELRLNSISYNLTVKAGYNELALNLYEDLAQVRKLMELAESGEWKSICVTMLPFQWNRVTFVPEVGKTYEFYLALCEDLPERVHDSFALPILAAAKHAQHSCTADESDYSHHSDFAVEAGNAVNCENSVNAGIHVLGGEVYSTDSGLSVSMNELTHVVSVRYDKNTYLTTGQGISVHIGRVSALRGNRIVMKRNEPDGYAFANIAVNFGARYANHTYVTNASGITKITDNLYLIDFDAQLQLAANEGISVEDGTECWLMLYGNSRWDTEKLQEGEVLENTYQLFMEQPTAFVYSRDIAGMASKLTEMEKEKEELKAKVSDLTDKLSLIESEKLVQAEAAGNILWGKKWFATGDSFTSGGSVEEDKYFTDGSYKGKLKTYPLFIGVRNHMDVTNDAISGSIMALDKSHVADPEHVDANTRRPFSYQRYRNIPEDVDYITLWFGINDASHTNLGTIDDATNETFYGAWNVVLEWILTNRPWAHVGMIITNGSSEAYRKAEREIARKWGIPYLDMTGDDQVPVMTLGRENSLGLCKKAYDLRRTTFAVGHAPTGDSHP